MQEPAGAAESLTESTRHLTERALTLVMENGMRIAVAVLVLAVGLPVTRWVARWIIAQWAKRGLDASLHAFLGSLLLWLFRAGLLVMVASMAGLEVTAFVAMLGGLAFAVGMALQGSLGNFAGGILILVLRPFRAGDLIEAQGHMGRVHSVRVFNTVLKTLDNRTIILPNGPLSNGTIVNFTLEPRRRVDMTFGISYGDDVQRARELILGVAAANGKVLKDPAPEVHLLAMADSSVNLTTRVWVATEDYWPVFFGVQEAVKRAFDGGGITIPFPQRDVHIIRDA